MRQGWIAAAAVLVAVAGLAAAPAIAADYKIGYVNVQKVVKQSEKAQKAKAQLEQEVQKHESELKAKRETIQSLQKELEKQGSLMSEQQKKEKQRKLQEAMREFRRLQQQAQEDLDTQKNQALQDLYDKVFQIVNRIGEKEDFDLIFTDPAAMYVADRIDLTQRVLDELNDGRSGG